MLPKISTDDDLMKQVSIESQPTHTYELKMYEDRMGTYAEDLDAMKQTVYHIINTERYQYVIYSWNYGVELEDLFGKPTTYCIPEIKRRITEALMRDERIKDVNSFEFSNAKGVVNVLFNVDTVFGNFAVSREVSIG